MVGPHDPATTMVYETDSGRDHNRGYTSGPGLHRIWLPRPAASISTVEDRYLFDSGWTVRDASEYYLSDGGRSVSLNQHGAREWFRELVRVTFTPVAENAERIQALIDLVRLETQDTGLASERGRHVQLQGEGQAKGAAGDHHAAEARLSDAGVMSFLLRMRHNLTNGHEWYRDVPKGQRVEFGPFVCECGHVAAISRRVRTPLKGRPRV